VLTPTLLEVRARLKKQPPRVEGSTAAGGEGEAASRMVDLAGMPATARAALATVLAARGIAAAELDARGGLMLTPAGGEHRKTKNRLAAAACQPRE
jgi:hypothetical protein